MPKPIAMNDNNNQISCGQLYDATLRIHETLDRAADAFKESISNIESIGDVVKLLDTAVSYIKAMPPEAFLDKSICNEVTNLLAQIQNLMRSIYKLESCT